GHRAAGASVSVRGAAHLAGDSPQGSWRAATASRAALPAKAGRQGAGPAQAGDRTKPGQKGQEMTRQANQGSASTGPVGTGPLLRPMTGADLTAVVELDKALFAEEAWSRRMLAGELEQQPASRYYL